ncbi:MAG: hypothetical protein AAFR61_11010 [Bacteroidota bacterium]
MHLIQDLLSQFEGMTKGIGEPVHLTDEAVQEYWDKECVKRPEASDTFHSIMNLKEGRFSHSHGTKKFFGNEGRLTYPQFLSAILPESLEQYLAWAMAAYKIIYSPESLKSIAPFKQEYRTMVPMRSYTGDYYWVSQVSTALQLDSNKYLISHFNTHRVSIAYDGHYGGMIQAEIFDQSLTHEGWTLKIKEEVLKKVFTPREVEVLNYYATGMIRAKQIAEKMQVTLPTIYSRNRDIVAKANHLFFPEFTLAQQVASYLSNQGMMPTLP